MMLVNEIMKAAIDEFKHPSILNFGTRADTMVRQIPFIKKRKIPRVTMVNGKVIKMSKGRITTFTIASINAEISAVIKPSMMYNLVILPTRNIDKARIMILIMKSIIS